MAKNNVKYWQIFDISLFGREESILLKLIEKNWNKKVQWIATVNPEFLMIALKDRSFLNILQTKTTVNVVDGIGLIWAKVVKSRKSKREKLLMGLVTGIEILMGKHRHSLITGADLIDKFCEVAETKGRSVYFFGGWQDRAVKTAEYFLKKYPKLKVVGAVDENFDFKTKTDYLFVARGMKKQEEWIEANFDKLRTKVVMGVGRSFDYYSGDLKRAPIWIRRMGLEWLYSLYREPKRWRRQLELPKFVIKVIWG